MAWGLAGGRPLEDLLVRVRQDDATLCSLTLLRGRKFDQEAALALAAALQGNTALKELLAGGHALGVVGAAALATALPASRV